MPPRTTAPLAGERSDSAEAALAGSIHCHDGPELPEHAGALRGGEVANLGHGVFPRERIDVRPNPATSLVADALDGRINRGDN